MTYSHEAIAALTDAARNILTTLHAIPARDINHRINGVPMVAMTDAMGRSGGVDSKAVEACADAGMVRIEKVRRARFVCLTEKGRAAVGFMQMEDAINVLSGNNNPAIVATVETFKANREEFAKVLDA